MGRRPCCSKEGLNRGAWNAHEDKVLVSYIKAHGEGNWGSLPIRAGLKRCGKSCRLRWLNYLRPGIKRGNISDEEDELIIRLHKLLGNRWSLIAGRLPGRTDNEIKNYWNTTLAKKVQGCRQHCKPSKLTRPIRQPDGKKLRVTSTATTAASEPMAPSSCNPQPPRNFADPIRTKALRCTRSFLYQKDDEAGPPKPAQNADGAARYIDAVDDQAGGLLACAALMDLESLGPVDDNEAPQPVHPNDQEVGGAADILGLYSGELTLEAAASFDGSMENYWCFQSDCEFNAQWLDSLLDSEEPYWA